MSVGLDTSVTLRLLTGSPADQAEAARTLVATATTPVVVSDLVISETYLALRHHYGVPHADAVRALGQLLRETRIRPSGTARGVLAELGERAGTKRAPDLIGRLIHADYARDDVTVATFDRDLARLNGALLLQARTELFKNA